MRARTSLRLLSALVVLALAPGCGGGVESPPSVSADAPGSTTADAGARPDAEPEAPSTTCCRLDNERGERLDYKCGETGVAIDEPKLEGLGYRCWLVR